VDPEFGTRKAKISRFEELDVLYGRLETSNEDLSPIKEA
jgi:hypothetical protein